MKKRARSPFESDRVVKILGLIITSSLGLPVSIALLAEAGSNLTKIAVAISPVLFCAVTGYLLLRLIYWLAPSSEQERDAE